MGQDECGLISRKGLFMKEVACVVSHAENAVAGMEERGLQDFVGLRSIHGPSMRPFVLAPWHKGRI
jgi:hypothetical protein